MSKTNGSLWLRTIGAGLASLGVGLMATTAAAVVCVDPNKGSCEDTIQAGVTAAAPGELVEIVDGTYFENVVIPAGRNGIRLKGESRSGTVIDPDSVLAGVAITIQSNDVSVSNLTIRNGQSAGIALSGVAGATIKRLTIDGPAGGCIVGAGDLTTVQDSTLRNCINGVALSGNGISILSNKLSAGAVGLSLTGEDARVEGNQVDRMISAGIIVGGNDAKVEANTVTRAGSIGINVNGEDVAVLNNKVASSISGLVVSGDDLRVNKNEVRDVVSLGIDASCGNCANAEVSGNTIQNLTQTSPALFVSAGGVGLEAKGNTVTDVSGTGILLSGTGIEMRGGVVSRCGSVPLPGVTVSGVNITVEKTVVSGCSGDGFNIVGDNHVIRDNEAKKNGQDGFDQNDGNGNAFLRNTAKKNNGMGIELSASSTNTIVNDNVAKQNRLDFCDAGAGTTTSGNTFGTAGSICAIGD